MFSVLIHWLARVSHFFGWNSIRIKVVGRFRVSVVVPVYFVRCFLVCLLFCEAISCQSYLLCVD